MERRRDWFPRAGTRRRHAYMNLHRLVLMGALLAFEAGSAEVDPQQCSRGDLACYRAQHIGACGTRGQSTPQSCRSWASSLEERAAAGDRAALHAQADACGFLASFEDTATGRESARQIALRKYNELASSDHGDPDVLTGLAALTQSEAERTRLPGETMQSDPDPIDLRFLAEAAGRSGDKETLLYAAMQTESAYHSVDDRNRWTFAASAIDLYRRAGDLERAGSLRQKARQDVGVPGVLRELSTLGISNSGRTAELQDSICGMPMVRAIGAHPCLEALELTDRQLSNAADRQAAQQLANRSAATIDRLNRDARRELEEADPAWHPKLLGMLNSIADNGLGSATTWFAAYWLDRTLSGKARALEQVVSFAPGDAQTFSALAITYAQLGRWDEALAQLRRAKAVTPESRTDLHARLDRDIKAFEELRSQRSAPSPR